MSNRLVSVIIVTKGVADYLASCLDSLVKQTYPLLEIIVIDNSGRKSFSQEIRQKYPLIKLFHSESPLSYCDSLNNGIALAVGEFILCLNDDVVLGCDFVRTGSEVFDLNPAIGMVSGKVLRPDARTIDTTGLFLSYCRTAKERGYATTDKGRFEKPGFIFGVNGAVAFYRRKMLEAIKIGNAYFDSDFRFFYEDLDIAWRAHNFGWKGYYNPLAVAYHLRGGTSRVKEGHGRKFARRYLNDALQVDLIKNRHLAIIKNESFLGFLLHLPGIIAYDVIIWCYLLIIRPNLIRGIFSKAALIRAAFKKRRILKLMLRENFR